MKTLLLLLGTVALLSVLNAQTNSAATATPSAGTLPAETATTGTNAAVKPPMDIYSDSGIFNFKSQTAVYMGSVRVIDAQMKLTCEQLTASVPEGGSRVSHIVAETNVVIDAIDDEGKPVHSTCDRAVYTYTVENGSTNEIMVLTGKPAHVESHLGPTTGDTIIWDRIRKTVRVLNVHMSLQPVPKDKDASTNRPPAVTPPPIRNP